MALSTSMYVAARSRAHGPTSPLWHAVESYRSAAELDGACELTVCGSLARISTEERWPMDEPSVCSVCAALTAH